MTRKDYIIIADTIVRFGNQQRLKGVMSDIAVRAMLVDLKDCFIETLQKDNSNFRWDKFRDRIFNSYKEKP
jgi:hypothetical protein